MVFDEIEQNIVQCFEMRVEQYAGKEAVQDAYCSLTFQQLNSYANQVAEQILKINPTSCFVGLYFDHTVFSMVAAIAVLKSGKVCVALNQSYSKEKTLKVIEQSEIQLILTEKSCYQKAYSIITNTIICDIESICKRTSTKNLGITISPDDYCYITYTTGSTGEPKGVIQCHRNLLHRTKKYTETIQITAEDRAVVFSHITYAAGLANSLVFLLNGASVHFYDLTTKSLEQLIDWLIVNKITLYHSMATIFLRFTRLLSSQKFEHIRCVRLGGEAVDIRHFQAHQQFFPNSELIVSYGATEANGIAFFFANRENKKFDTVLPVGYPHQESIVEIVDEDKNVLPMGEIGEIRVTSDYMSLGYLKKDNGAFTHTAGNKVYYTGDLGYFDEQGCLYLAGRKDSVIKVSGQKVSLKEVEVSITKLAQIKDCAVVASKEQPPYLIAYIVLRERYSLEKLRSDLVQMLSPFMIPQKFVVVSEIPLTANGKVNYIELENFVLPTEGKTTQALPRNFQETIIRDAFSKVLEKDIGIHDNFFEMGGHSLLITSLFEYIEQKMGTTLPVATIFEYPTIAQLAQAFEKEHDESDHIIAIRKEGKRIPLICIHSVEGNGLNYYSLARELDEYQPIFVINAPQNKDGSYIFYESIEQQVAHYIELLTNKLPCKEFLLLGHSAGGILAYEMARQLTQTNIKVPFLALLDTTIPKNKNYWCDIRNYLHFAYHFPFWLFALCKDKDKYKRLANIFGAKLVIEREPSWMEILAPKIQLYIEKTRRLRRKYFAQEHLYQGKINLFRIHRKNQHPKWRLAKDYGWKKYSRSQNVDVYYVAGGHRDMVYQENIKSLSSAIKTALSQIE